MVERTSTTEVRERPRFWRPWWPGGGAAGPRRGGCRPGPARRRWAARGPARSGAARGSDSVRSISARSSSRRTWRSNSRNASRGTASGRAAPVGGLGLALQPSVRRMRWTSTPITPEPRPGGRRRRWPAGPGRACRRRRSRATAARCGWPRAAVQVDPVAAVRGGLGVGLAHALLHRLALGGAEEEAVETPAPARAGPPGTWPGGRQRLANSIRSVQETASSAAKPSRSSEVPTAMPSLRSSSANSSSRGAIPGGRARRPCRRTAGG